MMSTHYDTLGVAKNATLTQIKQAYRSRVRHHHPDKTHDGTDETLIALNLAYEVLKDPNRRAQYDAKLALESWQNSSFVQGIRRMNEGLKDGLSGGIKEGFGGSIKENLKDNFGFVKQSVQTFFMPNAVHADKVRTSLGEGDMAVTVCVPIWQIALGEKVAVQAGERAFRVELPKTTEQGSLVIRGGGSPKANGGCGDVYVTIQIAPLAVNDLSEEQRQAYAVLKQAFET